MRVGHGPRGLGLDRTLAQEQEEEEADVFPPLPDDAFGTNQEVVRAPMVVGSTDEEFPQNKKNEYNRPRYIFNNNYKSTEFDYFVNLVTGPKGLLTGELLVV